MERKLAALLLLFALATRCAYADDFGPGGDIRELRFVASRLLANRVRQQQTDPKDIRISDVVVVGNAALLSWDAGKHHGLMGFTRLGARWWDGLDVAAERNPQCWQWNSYYPLSPVLETVPASQKVLQSILPASAVDAAAKHNADVRNADRGFVPGCTAEIYVIPPYVMPRAGNFSFPRQQTSGYSIAVGYTNNNSTTKMPVTVYARPPTDAEFIPYPTPAQYVPNAVLYFDLRINGTSPVTFAQGTTIDIWFPFVLDDRLNYDLTIGYADKPIGPIYARAFDNALHFVLPAFTVTPGRALMAEIDGNWH